MIAYPFSLKKCAIWCIKSRMNAASVPCDKHTICWRCFYITWFPFLCWQQNSSLHTSRYSSHWIRCQLRILSVHSVINYLRSYKFSFTRVFQTRPMTCFQERKGFRQRENVKEIIYVLSIELLRFGHCYDALHMARHDMKYVWYKGCSQFNDTPSKTEFWTPIVYKT